MEHKCGEIVIVNSAGFAVVFGIWDGGVNTMDGPCDSVWCYVKGPGPLTFGFKTLLKELDFSQTDATTIHADNQS